MAFTRNTTASVSRINYFFLDRKLMSSDVAHVNSASEGSFAERSLARVVRAKERGRSKKHRIACYRAGASKCSKYASNARPRGPNRPMQITERPPAAFV